MAYWKERIMVVLRVVQTADLLVAWLAVKKVDTKVATKVAPAITAVQTARALCFTASNPAILSSWVFLAS
jgi:hypothetical protein